MQRSALQLIIGCLFTFGSQSHSIAQCAKSYQGIIAPCSTPESLRCPTNIYIQGVAYDVTGPYNKSYQLFDCHLFYGGGECYADFPIASGRCGSASLQRQEVQSRLAELAKTKDIWIASCTGGLIPFTDRGEFNPKKQINNTELHYFDSESRKK